MQLGYTIFYVADVGASVTFFEQAFGMTKKFVTPENDYGELATGPTTLSFVSLSLAKTNLDAHGGFVAPQKDGPPLGASITLVCDDVDAAVAQAKAHGGTIYTPTTTKPWGQTVAYVRDPCGVLVEIGTPMSSPSDDES